MEKIIDPILCLLINFVHLFFRLNADFSGSLISKNIIKLKAGEIREGIRWQV